MACFGDDRAFTEEDIDEECPECGADTVGGESYDLCEWSERICDLCGYAPCDESC